MIFNILKEPLQVQEQTLHQQKALDLSFNLTPWKWAWHYQEGVTMTCCKITFFTPRAPMLFTVRGCGTVLIMPRPLSGCQIKAEIKGFLLRCRLFQYWQWFFHNLEVSRILVLSDAPCSSFNSLLTMSKKYRNLSTVLMDSLSRALIYMKICICRWGSTYSKVPTGTYASSAVHTTGCLTLKCPFLNGSEG